MRPRFDIKNTHRTSGSSLETTARDILNACSVLDREVPLEVFVTEIFFMCQEARGALCSIAETCGTGTEQAQLVATAPGLSSSADLAYLKLPFLF